MSATGVKAIALEADLWRELAAIEARIRRAPTKRLNARHELACDRLRRLGVVATTPPASERFAEHMLITHEEAREVRTMLRGLENEGQRLPDIIHIVLGRIALELDAHVPNDDEPPTTRST